MRVLYQELQVPLDAMTVGLQGLKTASLHRIDPSQHEIVTPYFDRLITALQSFSASHE
jgi:Phycobilisome protein